MGSSAFKIANEAPRPLISKLGVALQQVASTDLPLLLGGIQPISVRRYRFDLIITQPEAPLLSAEITEQGYANSEV